MLYSLCHRYNKKKIRTLITLLSAFILCLGCSEEDYLSKDSQEVIFSPTHTASGSGTTRVDTDDKWTGKEVFGICMFKGTSLPTQADFNVYVPRKSGTTYPATSAILDPQTSSETLYFPSDGTSRRFIAFSPYPDDGDTSYDELTLNLSNQSTADLIENVDFIYHKGTAEYNKSHIGSVPMEFTHKLSRIKITLTKGKGTSDTDFMAQKNLVLKNWYTYVQCNLYDGTWSKEASEGSEGTITPYRSTPVTINASTKEITCWAIVASGDALSNAEIDFGGVTSYKLSGQKFNSGESYEYTFEMVGKEVVMGKSTIRPWLGGTIATDGEYYLQVTEKELTHYKEASSGNTVKVYSNYKSAPTAKASVNWVTGVTVAKVSGEADAYTLNYNVAANGTTGDRSGTITVTAGNIKAEVAITQYSTSSPVIYGAEKTNCYILPPGGKTVVIPVEATVNAFRKFYPNHPAVGSGDYIPTILWSDVTRDGAPTSGTVAEHFIKAGDSAVQFLSYDRTNKSIRVTSGLKQGNVLVGLLSSDDGTILWSWHIWVTNYDPNVGSTSITSGMTVMNRSLGALSDDPGSKDVLGLMYQYGRKDPFAGDRTSCNVWRINGSSYTHATNHVVVPGYKVDISYSVQHAMTFFCTAGEWDWCEWDTEHAGFRWMPAHGELKSLDDPCPAGWRAPTNAYFDPMENDEFYSDYFNFYSVWDRNGKNIWALGGELLSLTGEHVSEYDDWKNSRQVKYGKYWFGNPGYYPGILTFERRAYPDFAHDNARDVYLIYNFIAGGLAYGAAIKCVKL